MFVRDGQPAPAQQTEVDVPHMSWLVEGHGRAPDMRTLSPQRGG